jgi:hypothetical protein
VIRRVAGLGLLLIDRMARVIRARMLLLLLLRGRLAVMLLVNNTRGPRMLQVRRNGTLLLVMWVVLLHRGDNH